MSEAQARPTRSVLATRPTDAVQVSVVTDGKTAAAPAVLTFDAGTGTGADGDAHRRGRTSWTAPPMCAPSSTAVLSAMAAITA
ncbi:MAG: hypothetical protein H6644_09580 [Caldilineaceae bacterium]|nr:hypothetical protein [Caldilineaceae bacterium]